MGLAPSAELDFVNRSPGSGWKQAAPYDDGACGASLRRFRTVNVMNASDPPTMAPALVSPRQRILEGLRAKGIKVDFGEDDTGIQMKYFVLGCSQPVRAWIPRAGGTLS